ncbi:serine/threonine-protein kinase ATM-like isoform X3 [Camellia sinensis]|uniref:serine/threonine-protein kinase ATM-like isoform X3 n=1 Tax=Camellia sinensis TaxID=4442 RepID=UPI0010367C46|nr:serine/threonine-protein kinase ATM-like isoform X3 [Camellia sinensis]
MKQMVEIYIKLAELETKRKDTNKKVTLPREIRSVQQLDLVPSYIGSYCNRMLLNDVIMEDCSTYAFRLRLLETSQS